jgi:hypothetical protein
MNLLLPLFWRRQLKALQTCSPGAQVALDTALNSLGERSLKVATADTQIKSVAAAGVILPAVPGSYYIIRGWLLSAYNAAAGTSTGTTITVTKHPDKVVETIAAISLVPTVASLNQGQLSDLGLVTEQNTAVTLADLTAPPTGEYCVIYYDEVRQVD